MFLWTRRLQLWQLWWKFSAKSPNVFCSKSEKNCKTIFTFLKTKKIVYLPQIFQLDYSKFSLESKWKRKICSIMYAHTSFESVKVASLLYSFLKAYFLLIIRFCKNTEIWKFLNFKESKNWRSFFAKKYGFIILKGIFEKIEGRKASQWWTGVLCCSSSSISQHLSRS